MKKVLIAFVTLLAFPALPAGAIQEQPLNRPNDVWRPASTPPGGVSWQVLEATREIARTGPDGYIISRPQFTAQVRRLEGRRIKVAGWMDAFEPGRRQTHFLLMAYPPGLPLSFPCRAQPVHRDQGQHSLSLER